MLCITLIVGEHYGSAKIRVPLSVPPGVKNFGPPNTASVIGTSCLGKNAMLATFSRPLWFSLWPWILVISPLKGTLISAEPIRTFLVNLGVSLDIGNNSYHSVWEKYGLRIFLVNLSSRQDFDMSFMAFYWMLPVWNILDGKSLQLSCHVHLAPVAGWKCRDCTNTTVDSHANRMDWRAMLFGSSPGSKWKGVMCRIYSVHQVYSCYFITLSSSRVYLWISIPICHVLRWFLIKSALIMLSISAHFMRNNLMIIMANW